MFEVTLLLLAMLLFAAFAFLPSVCSALFSRKPAQPPVAYVDSELKVAGESTEKPSFLAYLQSEIEAAFSPRPTDSILQRHYDAMVNAELESRLAAMPDS
jgi:hypothetical protein